jgi:hypothetical protein
MGAEKNPAELRDVRAAWHEAKQQCGERFSRWFSIFGGAGVRLLDQARRQAGQQYYDPGVI